MTNQYYCVLTDLGQQLITEAQQTGDVITITQIGFGDANQTYIDINDALALTALVNQKDILPLVRGPQSVDYIGGGIDISSTTYPDCWIIECGLFDDNGNLIAYAMYPPSLVPAATDAIEKGISLDIGIVLSSTDNITVYVDPELEALTKAVADTLYQPLDGTLTTLAALVTAANQLPYFSDVDKATLTALTAFGRSIIAGATAEAVRETLELDDSAQAKLVTSPTDVTAERVLTVGYMGIGRNTGGIRLASMADIDGSGLYVVHGVGFTDGTSTVGAPADSTAVQYALIVLNSYNGTYQLLLYGGDDSWFAYFDVVNMAPGDIVWSRNFTDSYPPTYTDTGAVQHMPVTAEGAGSKQWTNPWIGFAGGDGDLPAQTDDFATINISDPEGTGANGSYQILFDGDSSSNIANLNIFARGIEVAGLLSTAKVVKLFHTGQPPTAAQTKAIPTDIVGKIANGGSMAAANIPGWWQVEVPDPTTVAGFPKYASGSYLYGYGYMFVEVVGDTWFQLFYGHHGANATRQNWSAGPDTTTDWIVTYNEANPPSTLYLSDIQFGAQVYTSTAENIFGGSYRDWMAPTGCTITGIHSYNDNDREIQGIWYKPNQKKINGTWVTIAG